MGRMDKRCAWRWWEGGTREVELRESDEAGESGSEGRQPLWRNVVGAATKNKHRQ